MALKVNLEKALAFLEAVFGRNAEKRFHPLKFAASTLSVSSVRRAENYLEEPPQVTPRPDSVSCGTHERRRSTRRDSLLA